MLHQDIEILKLLAKKKRLSYQKLNELTGIGESKLKRLFSGRQDMTLNDRDKIITALGIKPAVINDGRHNELLDLCKQLKQAEYNAVMTLIRSIVNGRS